MKNEMVKAFLLYVCVALMLTYSEENHATEESQLSRLPNANWNRQTVHTGPYPYSVTWCGQTRTLLVVESVPDGRGQPTTQVASQLIDLRAGTAEKVPLRPNYTTTVCTPDSRYVVIARNPDAEKDQNDDDLYFYSRQNKTVIKILSKPHILPDITPWNLTRGLLVNEATPKLQRLPIDANVSVVRVPKILSERSDLLCTTPSDGHTLLIYCSSKNNGADFILDLKNMRTHAIHYGSIPKMHEQYGAGIGEYSSSIYILAKSVHANSGDQNGIVYRQDKIGGRYQKPKMIFQNVGIFKEMPDGRYMYTHSEASELKGLFMATNLGQPIARITSDEVGSFAISPDGKAVAYIALQRPLSQNTTSPRTAELVRARKVAYVITSTQ